MTPQESLQTEITEGSTEITGDSGTPPPTEILPDFNSEILATVGTFPISSAQLKYYYPEGQTPNDRYAEALVYTDFVCEGDPGDGWGRQRWTVRVIGNNLSDKENDVRIEIKRLTKGTVGLHFAVLTQKSKNGLPNIGSIINYEWLSQGGQ